MSSTQLAGLGLNDNKVAVGMSGQLGGSSAKDGQVFASGLRRAVGVLCRCMPS